MNFKYILALLMLSSTPAVAKDTVIYANLSKVSDGDTAVVTTSRKAKVKLRFLYVDCPEKKQPCGKEASDFTSWYLGKGDKLKITIKKTDLYGRSLSVVQPVCGKNVLRDVNSELLENGFAWVYYCKDSKLIELMNAARSAKKGLWSDKFPSHIPPWEYRKALKGKV
jgi:endonuclease YncB( thermonuclease family)